MLRYFQRILDAVSSAPFYTKWVKLPAVDDPIPPHILENPRWFPFFKDAIGAMDGTHINCNPSLEERHAARNRKGGITMDTICCCSFGMEFQHVTSGWEGSAADGAIWNDARLIDLRVLDGKYYLADAPVKSGKNALK